MAIVKLCNMHIRTDETRPEGLSECQVLLGIVRHWHEFLEDVREAFIQAKCSEMQSLSDGLIGSVLNGLEQIDPQRLEDEVRELLKARGEDGQVHQP